MKHLKKVIAVVMAVMLTAGLAACGGGEEKTADGKEKLTVAFQYGMAYAPLQVMKEKKLIEKYYDNVEKMCIRDREDPDVTLSAEERQIGGLGIFMVKKSMDDVEYMYQDGSNILTIKKGI